ncbi:unannotated protein [freshwater metagenome]|uniref:Unannotated protein n=1 Tax=freshwater metagenome TaxID=449393 RepID=A0A6J6MLW1_9ZZZZ|nr:FHA domain-containing protein [Actinomycetota bacterium]MSZ05718.1 FHA domain-containing protein [Actinomycetota bacterium]
MESKNELTSTLHLSNKGLASSPAGLVDEYLASLKAHDRDVISHVISTNGESAMVLISTGIQKGSRFLITDGATIGRSASSSIFLDDITVSRAHATIEKGVHGFQLTDAGSLNGTYVNNEQTVTAELKHGDEIQIGKFHLLFVVGNKK